MGSLKGRLGPDRESREHLREKLERERQQRPVPLSAQSSATEGVFSWSYRLNFGEFVLLSTCVNKGKPRRRSTKRVTSAINPKRGRA
jgi:hypothetical protein